MANQHFKASELMYVTHQKLYGCSIRDRGVINKQAISHMKIRNMANKTGLRSMLRIIFNLISRN